MYAEMKMDWWDGHDFENVVNVSTDLDVLYLNLFPHEGDGPIRKRPLTWPELLPGDLCRLIVERYPRYCQAFGYTG